MTTSWRAIPRADCSKLFNRTQKTPERELRGFRLP
jgi:hypothetical protein